MKGITPLGRTKEQEDGFGHWDRTQAFGLMKRKGLIRVINPNRVFECEGENRGFDSDQTPSSFVLKVEKCKNVKMKRGTSEH